MYIHYTTCWKWIAWGQLFSKRNEVLQPKKMLNAQIFLHRIKSKKFNVYLLVLVLIILLSIRTGEKNEVKYWLEWNYITSLFPSSF